jgi:hypothetical protein
MKGRADEDAGGHDMFDRSIRCSVLLGILAAVAPTLGCSGGEDGAKTQDSAVSVASLCATYCEKVAACDAEVDRDTCTSTCNDGSVSLSKMRGDVLDSIAACIGTSDCRTVLGDDAVKSCMAEAKLSVAPSGSAKATCRAIQDAAAHCDVGFDLAGCFDTVKTYSDETLDRAKRCTTKSCSALGDCLDATL